MYRQCYGCGLRSYQGRGVCLNPACLRNAGSRPCRPAPQAEGTVPWIHLGREMGGPLSSAEGSHWVEYPQDSDGTPLSARVPPAVELVDVGVQTEPVTSLGAAVAASPSTLSSGGPTCNRCEYLYQRLAAALMALTAMEERIRRMIHSTRPVTESALAEVAEDVTETPARRSAALELLRQQIEDWQLGSSDAPLS